MVGEPKPIPVGQEPPPLRPSPSPNGCNGRPPARHQGHNGKAKGKPARRKGDRFAVLNAFVDCTLAGLTRNEITVWLVLYRDTKPDGTARTGQTDIARRAGISARSVRRGIDGLRQRGLVKRVYQGGIGRGASAYRIRSLPPDGHGT
jgi:predicted DNA-binding transcriptional regulator